MSLTDAKPHAPIFGTYKTYGCDLGLFEKLGLKPFEGKSHESLIVGEVENKHYNSKVIISVYGCPALFWSFDIFSGESKTRTKIETGSGALIDYWKYVDLMMQGMIVAKKIEPVTSLNPPANDDVIRTRFELPVESIEAAELVKKGMQIAVDRIVDGLRKLAEQSKGKATYHLDGFIESLADSIEKTPITVIEIEKQATTDKSFGE